MKTQKTSTRIITINGQSYTLDAVLTDAEIMLLIKVGGSLIPIESDYIPNAEERYNDRVTYRKKEDVDFSISVKTVEVISYEEYKQRYDAGNEAYQAAVAKRTAKEGGAK